jgi:hypothetical protein
MDCRADLAHADQAVEGEPEVPEVVAAGGDWQDEFLQSPHARHGLARD